MKEDYYVIFSSVTVATGVKKVLEKWGITSVLMHTPKSLQLRGCSYAIKVKKEHWGKVIDAARERGADVVAVFRGTDGSFREVNVP